MFVNYEVNKNDYLIINDSFNIKHIVKVTNIMSTIVDIPRFYGGIVIKSLEKSNLNTINFTKEGIEMCFSEKPNVDTLEDEFPELWL